MSIPSTLIWCFTGLASCGGMVSLVLKPFWLIEAGPHRGRVHFITTSFICTNPCSRTHHVTAWLANGKDPKLPGMGQLCEVQPDIVHPGVSTTDVGGDGPALDKVPPHMVEVEPVQN